MLAYTFFCLLELLQPSTDAATAVSSDALFGLTATISHHTSLVCSRSLAAGFHPFSPFKMSIKLGEFCYKVTSEKISWGWVWITVQLGCAHK